MAPLKLAGFKDTRVKTLQITFGFDSPEDYMRFQQQITAHGLNRC